MKKGNIVLELAAMLVLGALGFWGLGEVVQYRMTRPLPGEPHLSPTGRTEPLQELRQGVRQSIALAETALDRNDKTAFAEALDAAKRASEVGRDAGEPTLSTAHELIQQARLSSQNGKLTKAKEPLKQAAARLEQKALGDFSARRPSSSDAYAGATLLSPSGARIGTVERVTGDKAEIAIGGKQNLLGFIYASSGRRSEVPLSSLVLGHPHTLGPTMAVLTGFFDSTEARHGLARLD